VVRVRARVRARGSRTWVCGGKVCVSVVRSASLYAW
jgi:hypothetical protein